MFLWDSVHKNQPTNQVSADWMLCFDSVLLFTTQTVGIGLKADFPAQVTGLITTFPSFGYSNVINLCRSQVKNQRAEYIMACKKLAGLLSNKGYTGITRLIGFAIERTMLEESDPNDPRVNICSYAGNGVGQQW